MDINGGLEGNQQFFREIDFGWTHQIRHTIEGLKPVDPSRWKWGVSWYRNMHSILDFFVGQSDWLYLMCIIVWCIYIYIYLYILPTCFKHIWTIIRWFGMPAINGWFISACLVINWGEHRQLYPANPMVILDFGWRMHTLTATSMS